jgi:predicted Zn-dependent peptidase
MAVAVSGKLVPGLMGMLEKTFGTVKQPKKAKDAAFLPFATPERLAEPVAFQQKKTEQVQLGMAFYGLPYGHKDASAATLLSTILGGTMSSRLFIQVRERRGLCYSINASSQAYEDVGVFSIMSGLEKTRVEEAVQVIWGELKKMTTKLVDAEELKNAKDHLRGKMMLAFEDSSTSADWYGKQWIFQKKMLTPEQRLKMIDAVTAADIREVAKKIFKPEQMASAVIGPFESKEQVKKMFEVK